MCHGAEFELRRDEGRGRNVSGVLVGWQSDSTVVYFLLLKILPVLINLLIWRSSHSSLQNNVVTITSHRFLETSDSVCYTRISFAVPHLLVMQVAFFIHVL